MPLLEVTDLHASYGNIHALKGVSLTVGGDEIVTLIGGNGAGKTTTLNAISGIINASEGSVLIRDTDLSTVPAHDVVRLGVVQVPEGRRTFVRLTVEENLRMGGFTMSVSDVQEGIERAFGLFPRLKERRYQVAGTLSGGEQQMLAIARGLMARPSLLLLDEPSMGLAPTLVELIFQTISDIHQQGTAILLVEQNAHMALEIADRGYIIQTGQIILSDAAANLAANEQVRQAYLGEI
jgi:branched-chain amino acid transport system ATP-binding protein